MYSDYHRDNTYDTNEDSIENVVRNINNVLSHELTNLLKPIVAEKYSLKKSILGLPYVDQIRNENIELKAKLRDIKDFYENTINNMMSEIQELKSMLRDNSLHTTKDNIKRVELRVKEKLEETSEELDICAIENEVLSETSNENSNEIEDIDSNNYDSNDIWGENDNNENNDNDSIIQLKELEAEFEKLKQKCSDEEPEDGEERVNEFKPIKEDVVEINDDENEVDEVVDDEEEVSNEEFVGEEEEQEPEVIETVENEQTEVAEEEEETEIAEEEET